MKRLMVALILASMLLASCGKNDNDGGVTSNETTSLNTTDLVTTEEETTELETVAATAPPQDGKVHVDGISLDKGSVTLQAGASDMPVVTMTPSNAENKNEIWESSDTSVAVVNIYGKITGISAGSCIVTVTSQDNPTVKADIKVNVSGTSSLTYINGILIVNKTYALPSSFDPGVNSEANEALNIMTAAAAKEGITLKIVSGYRSYSKQNSLYNNYAARDGVLEADRYSARPGHSEHQTGFAFDLNSTDQSFGQTKEGKWLAANCAKYGFIIRYPEGKEDVTGYMYEPWHVRYLGEDVAAKVAESGLCLEEYLNITSVYAK